jgi:hypothetical protein
MKELLAALERMIQEQQGTTEAVNKLNTSAPGNPKGLSYSQMGEGDIWQIARVGAVGA